MNYYDELFTELVPAAGGEIRQLRIRANLRKPPETTATESETTNTVKREESLSFSESEQQVRDEKTDKTNNFCRQRASTGVNGKLLR